MAKRSPKDQSKHDKAVEASARYYKQQGYKVQADLHGHDQPKTINNRRPDVRATKGGKEVIVEVETPDSLSADKAQHSAFQKYAEGKSNTKFRKKVTK